MKKKVYTITEIAEILGISRSYAYSLVKDGTIPSLSLGKRRVIPIIRFELWLNGEKEMERMINSRSIFDGGDE